MLDMFKDGADPEEISMSDVLCDFCGSEWKEEVPMIEGHQGSCICGKCLKMAWQQVVVNRMNDTHEDWTCRMCLEKRDEPCYRSPLEETAHICRRCIRMGAHALQSDDPESWDLPRRSHRE